MVTSLGGSYHRYKASLWSGGVKIRAVEFHVFFLQLMTILLTARLFAEVAVRVQVPGVIGELLAGIVLGPSLLGWLAPGEVLRLLADGEAVKPSTSVTPRT